MNFVACLKEVAESVFQVCFKDTTCFIHKLSVFETVDGSKRNVCLWSE